MRLPSNRRVGTTTAATVTHDKARRGQRRRTGKGALTAAVSLVLTGLGLAIAGPPPAIAAVTQRTECADATPAECVLVTEYPIPPPPQFSTNPGGITPGPDGRMWFTENAGSAQGIGAITPDGRISQYTIPTGGSHPGTIVAGPDGRLWFSEDSANQIGAVSTSGQFTEYRLPSGSVGPYDLAVGSDGRIWFTEAGTAEAFDEGKNYIGAITTSGQIRAYPVVALPGGLAEGTDGRIWFLDENGNIDAIATDGTVTPYPLPDPFHGTTYITAGPDGRLWITNAGGVAAVTTTGEATVYYSDAVPLVGRQDPFADGAWEISAGPDGQVWYFDGSQERLSAMTISGGQSGVFLPVGADPRRDGAAALATAGSGVHHMAQGFGKIWFTDGWPDDAIGAVTLNVPRPSGGPGTGHGSLMCVVPRLTGLTLGQARRRLTKAHCVLGRVTEKSRERGGGIISQRPAPGTRRTRGARVAVLLGKRRAGR